MPLSKLITSYVVILLFHIVDAHRHLEDEGDSGIPERSTMIVASTLVFICCVPLLCILIMTLVKWRNVRNLRNQDQDENEAVYLRATIISNLLRRDNDNSALRRAVLEKFFSDVSKCLTAKDCFSGHSFVRLQKLNSATPCAHEACLKNEKEDRIETGEEVEVQKTETSGLGESSPDSPNTHVLDDSSSDDTLEYNENGLDLSPAPRRSLFYNLKFMTDDEHGRLAIPPLETQKYNTICEGKEDIHIHDETDLLECGDLPLQKEVEMNVCPICLEQYSEGEFIIESKYCSHEFHKGCILLWLEQHSECPCCRESMITDEEVKTIALSVVGAQRMFASTNEFSVPY